MSEPDQDLGRRYLVALAALERGQLDEARLQFQRLTLDFPGFAPAWDGLGVCAERSGDLAQAGVKFRSAIRLDRQGWRSRYNWGSALQRAGDPVAALRPLKHAAKIAPGERCIQYRLGLCQAATGAFDEAIRLYERALKLSEREVRDVEVLLAVSAAESARGNLDAAEDACARACLIASDDPEVHYCWALLCERRGESENADRLANRAWALDTRTARYSILRVRLALSQRRWEVAENRIGDLGKLEDGERLRLAFLGELARLRGEREQAHQLALAAIGRSGEPNPLAIDTALSTLRSLHNRTAPVMGYRFVVEVECGGMAYYRPFVVLSGTEDDALPFIDEIQSFLDPFPWRVEEVETFAQSGEALHGVYHLGLSRHLFPRHEDPQPSSAVEVQ